MAGYASPHSAGDNRLISSLLCPCLVMVTLIQMRKTLIVHESGSAVLLDATGTFRFDVGHRFRRRHCHKRRFRFQFCRLDGGSAVVR